MLTRRAFAALLVVAAGGGFERADAQSPPTVRRVGVLLFGAPANDPNVAAFREGLRAAGRLEGRNVTLEYRYAEGRAERLPALAAELVTLKPDVIFAMGGDVAPHAKAATRMIPIVVATSADPVVGGLVTSLARPEGNVTGVTFVSSELARKRVQFLKEAAPAVSAIGVLWNPDHPDDEFRETQAAATGLGLRAHSLEVRRAADFEAAFAAATRARLDALVVVSSRLLTVNRARVIEFAARDPVLVVSGWGPWADSGALLSYGPDLNAAVHRAALLVDKILAGARPGSLPFEQPTKFELVLNLRTARAFGLTVPAALRLRADRLIE